MWQVSIIPHLSSSCLEPDVPLLLSSTIPPLTSNASTMNILERSRNSRGTIILTTSLLPSSRRYLDCIMGYRIQQQRRSSFVATPPSLTTTASKTSGINALQTGRLRERDQNAGRVQALQLSRGAHPGERGGEVVVREATMTTTEAAATTATTKHQWQQLIKRWSNNKRPNNKG